MPRHFLTGAELSAAELDALLTRAAELKRDPLASDALRGRSVALIFEKPSTRTRVSFEVGIHELAGNALVLRPDEMQITRGESMGDVARVQQTGPRLFDGERAAAPMKLLATHTAELEGLTPTHRFIIVHGVAYAQLRDGRIHRIRVFFDLYDAAVQLGVLPKPGTLGEKALLMLRGFGLRQR